MKRNIVMLTLPNCGSEWLADTIARANPELHYHNEMFFSPLQNWKHQTPLLRVFGDAILSAWRNLAADIPFEAFEQVVRETWGTEPYEFTKETYVAFQAENFHRAGFEVLGLLREPMMMFPPGRLRVIRWYDFMFHSALEAHRFGVHHEQVKESATTIERKTVAAFLIHSRAIERSADALGYPVLWYSKFMQAEQDELEAMFEPTPFHAKRTAEAVAVGRRRIEREPIDRNMGWNERWRDAFGYLEQLRHLIPE